jgi:hypothetical protein
MLKTKNVHLNSEDLHKSVKNEKNEDESLNKENDEKCFIYEDDNDCLNGENLFKGKEEKYLSHINRHKNSTDSNLTEKNLHKFLNEDLIQAINNDLVDPEDNSDSSECNVGDGYITGSSQCTSKANSPELNIRLPKIKKDISMTLNIENTSDNQAKDDIKEDDPVMDDIKEKIKILNDPSFTPMIFPQQINNKFEEKSINKKVDNFDKKEKKNNQMKNKFDDDVEPIMMLSMVNREEKTKLPLELRVGDWICMYCNNFNFSFRMKCNRCGLLRKSSSHILRHNYYNNKYQYMGNFDNNFNDAYYMNYNQNGNFNQL